MRRAVFDQEHEDFRGMLREFIRRDVAPHQAAWDAQGRPPREFFRKLGEIGVLGIQVPSELGGGGVTSFRYPAVVFEEVARAGVSFGSYTVHACVVLPYLLAYATEEQRQRWLPGVASGDLMTAIAMTEPGTGSDLAGVATTGQLSEDGSTYRLNGSKTFITGGATADLVLTLCRTEPEGEDRRSGLSLLAVPTNAPGFTVGRMLEKVGLPQQDTVELFFDDVEVPAENLVGEPGAAFRYLSHNLPQERLSIALNAVAQTEAALRTTVEYVESRRVFGQPLASFQNTKFVLGECSATAQAARVYVDNALALLDRGELTAADAARVKLFASETSGVVVDKCLQLHGGYGYMKEFPVARIFADNRVSRIYGGTSEVMKSIIAKDLGLR